jgi:hypothetical protein
MRNDDSFEPELEALRALPHEMDPGQMLEERTVRALRERGLVQNAHRPSPLGRWAWAAAAVFAAVLFSAGFWIGRSGTNAGAPRRDGVAREAKTGRDAGVASGQQPAGRDVTVATETQKEPPANSSERYVVWF